MCIVSQNNNTNNNNKRAANIDLHINTSNNSKRPRIDQDHHQQEELQLVQRISPLETDILFFGNANMTCTHPGNEAFADIAKQCAQQCSSSQDKVVVSRGIVEGLSSHLPPVRFFFRNKESGKWSMLSNSDAVLITNHALLAAERKAQQEQDTAIVSKYGATSWQTHFYRTFYCDPMDEEQRQQKQLATSFSHIAVEKANNDQDYCCSESRETALSFDDDIHVLQHDVDDIDPLPFYGVASDELVPLQLDASAQNDCLTSEMNHEVSSKSSYVDGLLPPCSKEDFTRVYNYLAYNNAFNQTVECV